MFRPVSRPNEGSSTRPGRRLRQPDACLADRNTAGLLAALRGRNALGRQSFWGQQRRSERPASRSVQLWSAHSGTKCAVIALRPQSADHREPKARSDGLGLARAIGGRLAAARKDLLDLDRRDWTARKPESPQPGLGRTGTKMASTMVAAKASKTSTRVANVTSSK